jgi:hypothetical protein
LRVPELGPFMGRVVTGSGVAPGSLHLDAIRHRLATRIFEAAGEARRLAGRDEREAAVAAIGRAAWLAAWEEAVRGVADLVADRAGRRLEAEARFVRLPRRKRKRLLLGEREKKAIAARLGSAGAALVPTLDELEERAAAAIEATALDRGLLEAWQDSLRTAARRLEAAWLDLEQAIGAEVWRWEQRAESVARWRKPFWPVVVVTMVSVAVASLVGLILGGQLDAPEWVAIPWQRVFGQ